MDSDGVGKEAEDLRRITEGNRLAVERMKQELRKLKQRLERLDAKEQDPPAEKGR